MASAVVDLYLARRRVRAEIAVGNFSRVSDLINSGVSAFLGGRVLMTASFSPGAPVGWQVSGSDFAIPLSAIMVVVPITEPSRDVVPSGLLREREHLRADLEVEEWHVAGLLHLVDRVRWVDVLASAQGKFIPVSEAGVGYEGTTEMTEADFMLVNGSRITALFATS